MTDFSVTTTPNGEYQDTRWRWSKHGEENARPGQLDADAFADVIEVHNGAPQIPSGTAVSLGGNGLYVPFEAADEDGEGGNVLAGFVNDNAGVAVTGAGAKPTFALLVHGIVKASLLPVAAQRDAVKTADATCSITYVED